MNRRAFLRMAPLAPMLPLAAVAAAGEAKAHTVNLRADTSEIQSALDERDRRLREQIMREWKTNPASFPGSF